MNYPQPYHSPMKQASNLKVTKFIMIETGTYNEQFRRPFEMDIRGDTLEALKSVMDQSNGNLTAANLSGISNQILRPQAIPESKIIIPNGWGQKRYRFMLEVEYDRGGFRNAEQVLGYTEYDGISQISDAIDENMKFFVNSVTLTRYTPILTAQGSAMTRSIANTSQVLVDASYNPALGGVFNQQTQPTYRLRPEDTFMVMSTVSDYPEAYGHNFLDGRVLSTNEPVLSNRQNNIASHYISKMVGGYNGANVDTIATTDDLYSEAMGLVRDPLAIHNVFLNNINKLQGTRTAAFTMRDLANIDPDIRHKQHIVRLGQVERGNVHRSGMTADWHASDAETLYASILSQQVPALMMMYGLTKVHLISTNSNVGGQAETRMHDARSFSSGDLTAAAQAFKLRFDIEVVRDLTYNNGISYYFECDFNLLGESTIKLSLNGSPLIDYVVPSFSDSLFTPMLTNSINRAQSIGTQFGMLFDNISYRNMDVAASQHIPFTEPQNSTGYVQYSDSHSSPASPNASLLGVQTNL